MKYQLKIGDKISGIEILPSDIPQTAMVVWEDNKMEVSFQSISDNRIQLKVDGKVVDAYLTRGPEGKNIFIQGRTFAVSEIDGKLSRPGRTKKLEDPFGEVTPPMPSVVVRILVKEGDWVLQGQGLIVVSAMKMETTLKAPVEGKVLKINTTLQAKVMPGDKLIEIEAGEKNDG
jgi:acetyl/propionyl-CoA carboxylase alpha subunit